jgi:hypothetical protein
MQEFRKTASPTFGPSFGKMSATLKFNYSKHPRKTAMQEFRKMTSPTFGPSFGFFLGVFANLQIRSIMVCT